MSADGTEEGLTSPATEISARRRSWAPRSAGSTLKPFTYELAFESGATPESIVEDELTEFPTPTGLYCPEDYDRRCYGAISYRLALANSLNISACKVLDSVGGAAILHRRLRDLGFTTLRQPADHYGLGLTIGNGEVRLVELANAYACLARGGFFRPYNLVRSGKSPAAPLSGRRVLDPDAARATLDILSDNNARALVFGVNSPLRFDFPVACKTGTSVDFRDNWAVGCTAEFAVAVWIGNFSGTPMTKVSGVSGAAPVMHEVMEEVHRRIERIVGSSKGTHFMNSDTRAPR